MTKRADVAEEIVDRAGLAEEIGRYAYAVDHPFPLQFSAAQWREIIAALKLPATDGVRIAEAVKVASEGKRNLVLALEDAGAVLKKVRGIAICEEAIEGRQTDKLYKRAFRSIIEHIDAALDRLASDARLSPPAPVPDGWQCAARKGNTGANDPQECDWPHCGCDPYADKVIAALQEGGWLSASPTPPASVPAAEEDAAALLEEWRKDGVVEKRLTRLLSEIARLRQDLEQKERELEASRSVARDIADSRRFWLTKCEGIEARLAASEAERERLRSALEKIASETAATWVSDCARQALSSHGENEHGQSTPPEGAEAEGR